MLSLARPNSLGDFTTDADRLLGEVRALVGPPNGTLESKHFKGRELWSGAWKDDGRHKWALAGAKSGDAKCAWCERRRAVKGELDVEHYRPKTAITQWSGDPPLVSDEPPKQDSVGLGYWWLAFSWENYSLSCGPCNRLWKRNLFPVADDPRVPCVEGVETIEQPLLLDPMKPFRTRDHFAWTVDGFMEPVSPQGRATIITCGLNRRPLPALRLKVALDVRAALSELRPAIDANNEDAFRRRLQPILRLGARDAEFAGMVRWIVENDLECDWEEL